ncbi:hypothetical protein Q8A73_012758 [Channa argus]|nr:hypothetical protein Q8A73_012758 [Channa argus]
MSSVWSSRVDIIEVCSKKCCVGAGETSISLRGHGTCRRARGRVHAGLQSCVVMTSLKTWCLLSLSVLLLSISPTETEVVQSMSDCEGFLLNENPPQIPDILINGTIMDQNRYKTICQTYENTRRFVTLYDTNNKIPVFSAYKYRGERRLDEDKRRPKNVSWKIEPQESSPEEGKPVKFSVIETQEAVFGSN